MSNRLDRLVICQAQMANNNGGGLLREDSPFPQRDQGEGSDSAAYTSDTTYDSQQINFRLAQHNQMMEKMDPMRNERLKRYFDQKTGDEGNESFSPAEFKTPQQARIITETPVRGAHGTGAPARMITSEKTRSQKLDERWCTGPNFEVRVSAAPT